MNAPAKVNLVLRVGRVQPNGLHELCSLFASLELADEVDVHESDRDEVVCAGIDGPNLAATAIDAFRARHPSLPPVHVQIDKRIPVAAGLAGGSADAAAVLRGANRIAGEPFTADDLRAIAATIGSDVPSQVEPAHAIVSGIGERVERVELPEMAVVLVPAPEGLSTADVYRAADRIGATRDELRCDELHEIARRDFAGLKAALENDLQPAALSLRPELHATIDAIGGMVSGSGPTVFALFPDAGAAEEAARAIPGAMVTMVARR